MLTLNELKNYRKWIGKPAQEVYVSALAAGGWKNVFPQSLPRWASKVRNFLNVAPATLERLPEKVAQQALKSVQRFAFLTATIIRTLVAS